MYLHDLLSLFAFIYLISLVPAEAKSLDLSLKPTDINSIIPTNRKKSFIDEYAEAKLDDLSNMAANDEKSQSIRRLKFLSKVLPTITEKGEEITMEKVQMLLKFLEENANKPSSRIQQLISQRFGKKPVRHPFIGKWTRRNEELWSVYIFDN